MGLFNLAANNKASPPVKKTKSDGHFNCKSLIYPSISNNMPLTTPERIAVGVSYPNKGKSPSGPTIGKRPVP